MCFINFVCTFVFFVNFSKAAVLNNKNVPFRLDIIHYNDFHDRFEETSLNYPVCKSNDDKCLGGFARLYYEVNNLLQTKPEALLLNAGDVFQGTYWYTLMKWNVTQHFINMLPNDVHTLGNHEFDDGINGLVPYLKALKAPVVVANMDTSQEPELTNLFRPYVVLERNKRKIGVIGLITEETKIRSNHRNVIFKDPIESVKEEAQKLTNDGIDIIIVLSHCGLATDRKIAETVGENIDIIVGGHTHSLLWNGISPSNETVSGPYPILVESRTKLGHKVLVVTASSYSKYLGNITAHFDNDGELVAYDGNAIFLNRSIPEDAMIKNLLKPFKENVYKIVNEVVGYADDSFLDKSCNTGECAIGNLIADAFLDYTQQLYISNHTHISFFLRNMIRGSINKGDITRGNLINAQPFLNSVVTLTLPGRQIKRVLERTMEKQWTHSPFSGPWIPQLSGIIVKLNTTSKKLISASTISAKGEYTVPLQMNQDYQFTIPLFLYKGGSFEMIKKYGRNIKYLEKDVDIVEKYIKKTSPIHSKLDRRLTLIT